MLFTPRNAERSREYIQTVKPLNTSRSMVESDPIEDPNAYPSANTSNAPLPLREVLTPHVITAVVNYSLLALLDIALRALQPLFYTIHIPYGGLGFSPAVVGLCLGAFGLLSGLYQAFIFTSIYDRFGPKRVFVTSMMTFVPMFGLFPLMNLSARHGGVNAITWVELALQGILYVIMDMGFSEHLPPLSSFRLRSD